MTAVGRPEQWVGAAAHEPVGTELHSPLAWQVTTALPPKVQLAEHDAPIAAPAQLDAHAPLVNGAVGVAAQLVGGPEQDPATKGSQAPDTWQVTLAVPPYVQLPAHTDPTEVPAQLPGHTPKASNAVGTDEQFVGGPAHAPTAAASQMPSSRHLTLAAPP